MVVNLDGEPVGGESLDREPQDGEPLDSEPLNGKPASSGGMRPSSETRLHLEIYRRRADVRAVAHTHSIYASAAAVVGRDIPPLIDEMLLTIGGPVKVSSYAFPGTQELAEAAYTALGDRNAALLRNHGVVGRGAGYLGSAGSLRPGGTAGADLCAGAQFSGPAPPPGCPTTPSPPSWKCSVAKVSHPRPDRRSANPTLLPGTLRNDYAFASPPRYAGPEQQGPGQWNPGQ